MDSDITTDTTNTTVASRHKKPKRRNFFKCWGKDKGKGGNDSVPSSTPDRIRKTYEGKGTTTEEEGINNKRAEKKSDGEGVHDSQPQQSKEKQQTRCPKCFKKKREREPIGQRVDRRYCKCRKGGYCNTNTIIFPNDFKQNSIEAREIHYLQLIKEIIQNETRKNVTDVCDVKREIDRQREEIKELKNLLLQNLLGRKNNDNNDQQSNDRTDEASELPSLHLSRRTSHKRSSSQIPPGQKHGTDNQSISLKAETHSKSNKDENLDENKHEHKDENKDENRGFWNKLFSKK